MANVLGMNVYVNKTFLLCYWQISQSAVVHLKGGFSLWINVCQHAHCSTKIGRANSPFTSIFQDIVKYQSDSSEGIMSDT